MNNFKTYEKIKSDIKTKLKEFDKIKTYNAEDMNFQETIGFDYKLEQIREKLDQEKELSKVKKEFNKKHQDKNSTNINNEDHLYDEFRNFNIFIPKIEINQSKNTRQSTFGNIPVYYDNYKPEEYNFYEMNPITDILESKNIDSNSNYINYQPDPLFFSNRLIEIEHIDISDKYKKTTDNSEKFYQIFSKRRENKNTVSANHVDIKSRILPFYYELKHLDNNNDEVYDDLIMRDDELNLDNKKNNEELNRSNPITNVTEKINLEDQIKKNYKEWLIKTNIEHFGKNKEVRNMNLVDLNNDNEIEQIQKYDNRDISFRIDIIATIEKQIIGTNRYHQRDIHIEGPLVKWYRFKDVNDKGKIKGLFDLRKNKFGDDKITSNQKRENLSNITFSTKESIDIQYDKKNTNTKEDIIEIDNYKKELNGNEITNKILFKSPRYDYFDNKSFKEIFEQIKKYYQVFYNFIIKINSDYENLKILCKPDIDKFTTQNFNKHKNYYYELFTWQNKLRRLHLTGLEKQDCKDLFTHLGDLGIYLEYIYLQANDKNHIEFDIKNIPNIKDILKDVKDFHLVNFNITDIKPILETLKKNFDANDNNYKLPYKNISFKNLNLNDKTKCIIDLRELEYFFMDMLKPKLGEIYPIDVFECLDLTGCLCLNIEGLVNIINDFKIILKLNISKTK